jgi:hypothetical protein
MARNPVLDDLSDDLARHVKVYRELMLDAGDAEADYRHARAAAVDRFRREGNAAGMAEYLADADAEIYRLHKARLRAAALERSHFEHLKELHKRLDIEQTQTVNER